MTENKLRTLQYTPPPNTKITAQSFTLALPIACCPVSKNPREGSTITIRYTPRSCVLEVGALFAYLQTYRGGLKDETGAYIVRDMEGMIMQIARDCGLALGTNVEVQAEINLRPFEIMRLTARYKW